MAAYEKHFAVFSVLFGVAGRCMGTSVLIRPFPALKGGGCAMHKHGMVAAGVLRNPRVGLFEIGIRGVNGVGRNSSHGRWVYLIFFHRDVCKLALEQID
jgi:hypothetical protein